MDVPTTLLVSNDYPPRIGGIQRTLESLVDRLPPDRVGVFAPMWPGASEFDGRAPYRTFRQPERFLLPSPSVAARIERAVEELGADVVLFGATYPLALLGPRLARRGIPYLAAAHGFEYWLSIVPGTYSLVRRATSRAAHVPVLCSEFIARRVRTAVPANVPLSVIYPAADIERFHPDQPAQDIRARHGLGSRPLVVCVSRLVARKGQDMLIRSMSEVRRRVPDAALLIVGRGPHEPTLRAMAEGAPGGSVVFAGEVEEADLPRYYAAGDVFAMPCRNRLGGLEVEGWGSVFIEAAACARPVVVGDSGGASEAVVDGETGLLVDGRSVAAVADAVGSLLEDPERAAKMGTSGRERVERSFTWDRAAAELAQLLRDAA